MVSGIMSALRAAAGGVQSAHQRAADAAVEIDRAGRFEVQDTVSISGAKPPEGPPPDMVRGMVDLRIARYQQTASLAVLETASEMSREVAEIAD